jgi:hypothetical protein
MKRCGPPVTIASSKVRTYREHAKEECSPFFATHTLIPLCIPTAEHQRPILEPSVSCGPVSMATATMASIKVRRACKEECSSFLATHTLTSLWTPPGEYHRLILGASEPAWSVSKSSPTTTSIEPRTYEEHAKKTAPPCLPLTSSPPSASHLRLPTSPRPMHAPKRTHSAPQSAARRRWPLEPRCDSPSQ